MVPCVCSVIDHRGCQNVVRTSVTHSVAPRVPLFCSYHILMSSVIYYWTDARQPGIYLLIVFYFIQQFFSCLSGIMCAVTGWFSGPYSKIQTTWLSGVLSSSIQISERHNKHLTIKPCFLGLYLNYGTVFFTLQFIANLKWTKHSPWITVWS